MRRFKSVRQAQQFLATHTPIHNHFQLRRHRLSASEYRAARDRAFATWCDVTGVRARGLILARKRPRHGAMLSPRCQVDGVDAPCSPASKCQRVVVIERATKRRSVHMPDYHNRSSLFGRLQSSAFGAPRPHVCSCPAGSRFSPESALSALPLWDQKNEVERSEDRVLPVLRPEEHPGLCGLTSFVVPRGTDLRLRAEA